MIVAAAGQETTLRTTESTGPAAVRREYQGMAPRYDRRWRGYLERSLGLTLDHVTSQRPVRILDVGCGTGLLLERLHHRFPDATLTGIDVTPGMLTVAAQRLGPRADLLLGDASALPLREGAFDVVVSSSVWHYLRAPDLALAEWRRVLRPGGSLIVTDWSRDFVTMRALNRLLKVVNRAHWRTWNEQELRAALRRAGFTNIEVDRHRQGWFWGMMVGRASRP